MERSIQSNAARRHAIAGRRWRWHAGTRAATIPPDRFVYDPATPVPTWSGGNIGVTELAGARDQWPIEGRHDVLVYTSDVLREDVELTGTAVVELWAASSAPDTDIVARLVDVAPDGTAYNVAEGIVRARHRHDPDAPGAGVPLEPGEPSLFRIALTAWVSQAPRPAPKITSRPRRQ